MKAIENESIILESTDRRIMLTSHRLRYHDRASKHTDFISIMLDKISSIELTYQRNLWLLIIGILTIPVLVGVVLLIFFFLTKKHIVSITPDGGKPIVFETNGMKREFLEDFIYQVEKASINLKYHTLVAV